MQRRLRAEGEKLHLPIEAGRQPTVERDRIMDEKLEEVAETVESIPKSKGHILLVWVRHPEENCLFRLEGLTDNQLRILYEAHDLFMRNLERENSEATHKIATAVGYKKRDEIDPEWDSIWVDKRDITLESPCISIAVCGW